MVDGPAWMRQIDSAAREYEREQLTEQLTEQRRAAMVRGVWLCVGVLIAALVALTAFR